MKLFELGLPQVELLHRYTALFPTMDQTLWSDSPSVKKYGVRRFTGVRVESGVNSYSVYQLINNQIFHFLSSRPILMELNNFKN